MSWTKREFVTQALEEIGLASYVFDLQPEQMNSARIKLDAMMAAWSAIGINVNYPLPSNLGDSDLDEDSGVMDAANEAIYLNLAIKLAPSYGKQLSVDTRISAKTAYDSLLARLVRKPEMRLPSSMPIGAGHKEFTGNTFVRPIQTNAVGSPTESMEILSNDN